MFSPKKRSHPLGDKVHPRGPNKRLKVKSPKLQLASNPVTGLEGVLSLDRRFVQASQETFDSETTPSEARDLPSLIAERARLAKSVSNSLSWLENAKPTGMVNHTGAVCYRHSLFQAILHMPHFVNWLLEGHQPEDSDMETRALPAVFATLLPHTGDVGMALQASSPTFSSEPTRSSTIVSAAISGGSPNLLGGWSTHNDSGHGDPDDQLGWILSEMRGEVPLSTQARFDAFSHLTLSSSITCKKCGHTSTTEGNEERHLSIPIKPEVANSIVQSYVAKYMIEMIEDYRCGNPECRDTSRKFRIQKIAHAPEILVVQLKRFDWEGRKVNTFVQIDDVLDLNKYRLTNSVGNLEYHLQAVVEHTGSLSFGHYHCVARHSDSRWYDFNDSTVSHVRRNHAFPHARHKGGYAWTPYLLFYQRRS